MEADYVIVGAGSAGCVLANRLSEDAGVRVALLEAGGPDRHPYIHIPAGFMKLLDHPTITWGYRTEADPDTNDRAMIYPRGRGLGGSSQINGLAYVRSQPEDFDHWAQLGNRGWSYDDVLPHFKRSESWVGGEDAVRGGSGPLRVSRQVETPVLCEALIEAGGQIGLERREDINSRHPGGIGYVQMTRRGRFRASTGRAYLAPAAKRPNLQVVVHAQARRILFDGKRATGVEFARGNAVERITARRAVILASGAVGSPHLLQVSGVGAPDHLGGIGVPVHHALPGVGQNLNDHYLARVSYRVVGASTANERSQGLALVREVLRYAISGGGILAFSASLVHAYAKVLEESATTDMQLAFAPGSFKDGQIGKLDAFPGISGGGWQMRPLSRGTLLARSADPLEAPAIRPRFLSHPTDCRAIVEGLKLLRRIFAAPAIAHYLGAEILPRAELQTDDELLDYARRNGSTVYHTSGTCKMGQDPLAVVDERLRVHGLDGLRVIDASIMPAVTSTNTNSAVIMSAEKASDMIKADAA
ncbi:MAG: GMC family oxidoreductase N-terminal domain-containing protein [Proteobacteria bacterium]|nr:GMC family oxidoreductase N-terminal domain-containing protein [Pseudomonadota bacterium]